MVRLDSCSRCELHVNTRYSVAVLCRLIAREVAQLHVFTKSLLHLCFAHGERQADGAPLIGTDGALHADVHARGCSGGGGRGLIEYYSMCCHNLHLECHVWSNVLVGKAIAKGNGRECHVVFAKGYTAAHCEIHCQQIFHSAAADNLSR